MNNNNDISRIIYNKRKDFGMSMQELADKVGVSKSTIKKWESGQIANMRRDKIDKVAKALCISPTELMGWEDPQPSIFDYFGISEEDISGNDNNQVLAPSFSFEENPFWADSFIESTQKDSVEEVNISMDKKIAIKYIELSAEGIDEVYKFINDVWKRESIAKLKAEIAEKEAAIKRMEEGN